MKFLAVLLLLVSGQVFAQYTPVVTAIWDAVTTQEDGTVVDSTDISYVVYPNESTSYLDINS